VITGSAGLSKTGAGTLVLTGTNTLTGSLIVSGGMLKVTGWSAGAATVSNMPVSIGKTGMSNVPSDAGSLIEAQGNVAITSVFWHNAHRSQISHS